MTEKEKRYFSIYSECSSKESSSSETTANHKAMTLQATKEKLSQNRPIYANGSQPLLIISIDNSERQK